MLIGLVAVVVLAGASFASYQAGFDRGAGGDGLFQAQGGETAPATANIALGTVEKISGQDITLKDVKRIPETPASTANQSSTVVVTVGQATVIERLVQKSVTVLNKEMAAYSETSEKLQAQGAVDIPAPPEPFTREKIALKDIQTGDTLVAFSAGDISTLSAFTTTRIEVQFIPQPVTSTAAPASAGAGAQTGESILPPPPIPSDALKP